MLELGGCIKNQRVNDMERSFPQYIGGSVRRDLL